MLIPAMELKERKPKEANAILQKPKAGREFIRLSICPKALPVVIILSEMGKRVKAETKVCLALPLVLALVTSTPAHTAASTASELRDCNWIVSYRGRTYDLAPLTREALARPIETDIRHALQRVPESNEHLNRMSARLKDARAHTILASVFISGLIASRIMQSREKNPERRREYDYVTGAAGGFFLAATAFSWRATREAKGELVQAVDAFNRASPHKIVPTPNNLRPSEAPISLDR
jgi:hypothetical protein